MLASKREDGGEGMGSLCDMIELVKDDETERWVSKLGVTTRDGVPSSLL